MLKLKQLQNKSLRKYKTLYGGIFFFFFEELIAVILTLMFSIHTVNSYCSS